MTPTTKIRAGTVSVKLIDHEDSQVNVIKLGEGFEDESLQVWSSIVQPNKTVIDVGAYTGLFSIVAAKLGANVVALEPMPKNISRIRANLALNDVIIRLIAGAASDRSGKYSLNYNSCVPFLTAGASLDRLSMHNSSFGTDVMTIDGLKLFDVVAIKVDVEKHELAVLRGASQTIERDRPSLLIETLDGYTDRDSVLKVLPNYRIDRILDVRNTLFLPN